MRILPKFQAAVHRLRPYGISPNEAKGAQKRNSGTKRAKSEKHGIRSGLSVDNIHEAQQPVTVFGHGSQCILQICRWNLQRGPEAYLREAANFLTQENQLSAVWKTPMPRHAAAA